MFQVLIKMFCQVENIVLEIPFPKSVLNVTLTTTQGKYSFDPVTKVMTWDVGKMDSAKLPNIRGLVSSRVNSPERGHLVSRPRVIGGDQMRARLCLLCLVVWFIEL